MAGRGRGRGRGRGGYGGGGGMPYAKQEPFELFPKLDLPDPRPIIGKRKTEEELVGQSHKFLRIWRGSPFYLEQITLKERQNTEVERYADRNKPKHRITRGSLFDILELNGFPQELTGGSRARQPSRKRGRWNPDSDLQRLDFFEGLELRQGNKDGKEKKEGEGEDEDENENEEEAEDEYDPSDDDYCQTKDFDDDEDDFNMGSDHDDEGLL